jgi:hypothetical protein
LQICIGRLHLATVPFGRPPSEKQLRELAADPMRTMGLPLQVLR